MPLRILTITFILLLLVSNSSESAFMQTYINPKGTYSLVNKVHKKGEDTYGVTGSIQVKALSPHKVIIVLGVDIGAPSYNSGMLCDTLKYKNNSAIYKGDESDTSCRITFKFSQTGIIVVQKQDNLNYGCGFGHGVFADGFYRKKSAKVTFFKDTKTGELTYP